MAGGSKKGGISVAGSSQFTSCEGREEKKRGRKPCWAKKKGRKKGFRRKKNGGGRRKGRPCDVGGGEEIGVRAVSSRGGGVVGVTFILKGGKRETQGGKRKKDGGLTTEPSRPE